MPKVYVVQQQPNHDISAAEEFGEIVVLLPPGGMEYSIDFAVSFLSDKLSEYTNEDFILLTGDPIFIAAASIIAWDNSDLDQPMNFLKWDRRLKQYKSVWLNYP